jgi:hypothetical protein
MKKIFFAAAAWVLLFTGCTVIINWSTPYDIVRTRGWYGGDAIYELKNNRLLSIHEKDCRSLFCVSDFQFNMRKYITGNNIKIFIMIDYEPSLKTYMQTVDRVTLTVDGKRIKLKGSKTEGNSQSAGIGSLEMQRSYYDCENADLLKVAWAKDVKLTLEGRWYDTVLYFSQKNIENTRLFYFNYLKPENR